MTDSNVVGHASNSTHLVSVTELKQAFETGAIPTEADYHDLIKLADIGRQAVGLTPALVQASSQATGLSWSPDEPLKVRLAKSAENQDISGLKITKEGLSVSVGQGLVIQDGSVKVSAAGALKVDEGGLSLQLDKGLTQKDSFLALQLDSAHGGLQLGAVGLAVKLKMSSGLSVTDGLSVVTDNKYLTITQAGLALTNEALKKAVDDIGGALAAAIGVLENYDLASEKALSDKSKVVSKLQEAFLRSLQTAGRYSGGPPLKGWAASMQAALARELAAGQSVMVQSLLKDAGRRGALEQRVFYSADNAKGIFLAVRALGETPQSPKSNIDAGGCIVVFSDSTVAIPNKLYVGFGGYYLAFSDLDGVKSFNDISHILLPGSIDGRSVMFDFNRPSQ